jgi:hypothetical protein
MAAKSGAVKRLRNSNSAYFGLFRHQPQASAVISQASMAVATAQPVEPIAVKPSRPYMNRALSGTLSASDSRLKNITGRGRLMPVERPKNKRKAKAAGTPQADVAR